MKKKLETLPWQPSLESWNIEHPFAKLFSPLHEKDFIQKIWNKKIYHFRSSKNDRFAKTCSLSELNRILSKAVIDDRVVVTLNRKSLLTEKPLATARNLLRGRVQGSIIVNSAQVYSESLSRLCGGFQSLSGSLAMANIYFSAAGGHGGFDWHWDTHDIFVCQISGRKKWSIYAPQVLMPFKGHLFHPQQNSGAPIAQLTLSPGDMLYIPRGFPHRASTLRQEKSLHVSVGLHPIDGLGLCGAATQLSKEVLAENINFRIPLTSKKARKAKGQKLLKILSAKIKSIDVEEVYKATILHSQRKSPLPHLRSDAQKSLSLLKKALSRGELSLIKTDGFTFLNSSRATTILENQNGNLIVPKFLKLSLVKTLGGKELYLIQTDYSARQWEQIIKFAEQAIQLQMLTL